MTATFFLLIHLTIFYVHGVNVTIKPISGFEVVWNWTQNHCFDQDLPDIPARAYKADNGSIIFMDSNANPFGALKMNAAKSLNNSMWRDCNDSLIVSPTSYKNPNASPSGYNNSWWLQSFWREPKNENIIHAIVHNEFHGQYVSNNSGLCPSGIYDKCQYWNNLAAISTDKGNTFKINGKLPNSLTMTSPFKYIPDGGIQGMTAVSNILSTPQNDGYAYILALRYIQNGYKTGVCLYRTSNITDPTKWRAWNGTKYGFNIKTIDPYLMDINDYDPNQYVCKPLNNLHSSCRFSWSYNKIIDGYIAIGVQPNVKWQDNTTSDAIVYSLSYDMYNWSDYVPFLKINSSINTYNPSNITRQFYPSLIDETSVGVNFEYSGVNPYIYMTQFNPVTPQNNDWNNRDIVRVSLKVSKM